jgi:hypothetical protein
VLTGHPLAEQGPLSFSGPAACASGCSAPVARSGSLSLWPCHRAEGSGSLESPVTFSSSTILPESFPQGQILSQSYSLLSPCHWETLLEFLPSTCPILHCYVPAACP